MNASTEALARTLGYEVAHEVRSLTELSADEVECIAGARMTDTWSSACDGRCTDQAD